MRALVAYVFIVFCTTPLFLLGASANAADITAEQGLLQAVPDWLQIVSIVIAAASAISAITPTPKDDGIVLIIRKIIDLFALNVGKAKNERTDKTPDNNP